MKPQPSQTPVRLAFSALFVRLLIGFGLLIELWFVVILSKKVPPNQWVIAFVVWSPFFLGTAFMIAACLTLLSKLAVGLIIRPRLLAWQSPKVDDTHDLFHLEPREAIIGQSSARMRDGRAWVAGRLVKTNRRILFLPRGWNVEPWSTRSDRLCTCRDVDAPRIYWGLIQDLPRRLELQAVDEQPRLFALADAHSWVIRLTDGPLALTTPPSRSF